MAVHWRVTETYIKCICDSITMGTNFVNVFKYHPVIGSGYIELNGNTDWGDDVIPIEYDRFKTRVELLKDLGYSVMFIATKLGTTEEEVRKIVGKDYVHKDYSEMRSEYFMLLNANSHLRNEVRAKNDEIDDLKVNNKALRAKYDAISGVNDCIGEESKRLIEENAKLKQALESEIADNLQFEQRGKELIEENARLSAALKSEEEANDILTKRIAEANNEIDDLKRQYEMLQAKHDTLSGVNACWNEENEKLTKQISDLRSAYDRIYRSRDEHIEHNEALERKVKELTTENEEQRTIIRSLTEYKDSWVEKAHQYEKELATVNAKNDEATREMRCLRTAVSTWRAQAFDRYEKLCTQRDMAIRLLFTTHDYDEIAGALHIPESLIREIIKEGK